MRLPIMLISALAFAGAPAAAATYSAKPASAANGHIVARDINWSCGAEGCQGTTQESRPAVLCQALAKQAGKLENFQVDGRAFTTAELDKCNAAAKGESNKALAAQ